jgi:hypothetical protein
MPEKRLKRPRDPAQLAKLMIDIASGEVEDRELTPEEQGKDPLRTTPAMAAKVTERLWEMGDIVDMLEAWVYPSGDVLNDNSFSSCLMIVETARSRRK